MTALGAPLPGMPCEYYQERIARINEEHVSALVSAKAKHREASKAITGLVCRNVADGAKRESPSWAALELAQRSIDWALDAVEDSRRTAVEAEFDAWRESIRMEKEAIKASRLAAQRSPVTATAAVERAQLGTLPFLVFSLSLCLVLWAVLQ